MPDHTMLDVYAKTEEEMDRKLAELAIEIQAGVESRENPAVSQYAKKWFAYRTAEFHQLG